MQQRSAPGIVLRDQFYRDVGSRIKALREAKNFSQRAIAESVGLSRTSLTNIERGRQKLLLHTFSDIAAALGVTPVELFPKARGNAEIIPISLPKDLPPEQREFVQRTLNPTITNDTTTTKSNSGKNSPVTRGIESNRRTGKR